MNLQYLALAVVVYTLGLNENLAQHQIGSRNRGTEQN